MCGVVCGGSGVNTPTSLLGRAYGWVRIPTIPACMSSIQIAISDMITACDEASGVER